MATAMPIMLGVCGGGHFGWSLSLEMERCWMLGREIFFFIKRRLFRSAPANPITDCVPLEDEEAAACLLLSGIAAVVVS